MLLERYIAAPEMNTPLTIAPPAPKPAPLTPNVQPEVQNRPTSFLGFFSSLRDVTNPTPSPATVKSKAPPIHHNFRGTSEDMPLPGESARFHWTSLTGAQASQIKRISVPLSPGEDPLKQNPFSITSDDFESESYLPWPLLPVPQITPFSEPEAAEAKDVAWFDQVRSANALPDVFIVAGHHVISEGYHDHRETGFLFQPSLFSTIMKYPVAKEFFDHIKLAILFGCNTLTDLEPHHADGSIMTPQEMVSLAAQGTTGLQKLLGTSQVINSLEFYKDRLAREYRPGAGHPGGYTRIASEERCEKDGSSCDVTNLERIMPIQGLYDGTSRYNEARKMRELFPNAYLVLGFSSASPSEEMRVGILRAAVEAANRKLGLKGDNVIHQIVDENTSENTRRIAVAALREAWEMTTFKMNRGRPSGSITPKYPDIDDGRVMYLRQTNDPQLNSKYR